MFTPNVNGGEIKIERHMRNVMKCRHIRTCDEKDTASCICKEDRIHGLKKEAVKVEIYNDCVCLSIFFYVLNTQPF
jgi:hypothetical protein